MRLADKRSNMELRYDRVIHPGSSPEHWALSLHGFFGRREDWREVAQQTVAKRPDWGIALVDLRLHGESTRFDPPHTVQACVEDVRRLMALNFGTSAEALIGHSFGGKVALGLAQEAAASLRQGPTLPDPAGIAGR